MNSMCETEMKQPTTHILGWIKDTLSGFGFTLDAIFFLGIITVLNFHLLQKGFNDIFIFSPSAVGNGQWWRVFTHPFVHISAYHLILDAGAFILLYTGLSEKTVFRKVLYVIICGFSSLFFALAFSPDIYSKGLCGLSGIAHGLMAVSALEMMQKKKSLKPGLITLGIVIGKCIYEVFSGHAAFLFMHMGLCGDPLVACHVGGVTGGVIMFLMFRWGNSDENCSKKKSNLW